MKIRKYTKNNSLLEEKNSIIDEIALKVWCNAEKEKINDEDDKQKQNKDVNNTLMIINSKY